MTSNGITRKRGRLFIRWRFDAANAGRKNNGESRKLEGNLDTARI